ncbi:pilus assembly protein TadG-related protein [Sinomonas sp. B1-1]|uniref:pilus assembly protein TadG-related protein n=1 Tax=Sinomonas sp. B1-1 TaxID=3141454 RepID=UPI003D2CCAF2
MRRLTLARPPRTHDAAAHRERGAVAVVTAILMVVLLGFAALAVDGGMLYAKRGELQNGADAAAIAVAQKCAASLTDPLCSSTSSLASSLAQSNTALGQGGIASLTVNGTARTATATTQPLEPGSQPGSVALYFARVLGINSAVIGATAQAAWGSPSTGLAAFPLAFSVCQLQGKAIDGGLQLIQSFGSGVNPSCTYGTPGQPAQTVPGGFGWLQQNPNQCGASINVAASIGGSQPGASGPDYCDSLLKGWIAALQAGQRVVVLLPVFTAVSGTGKGAVYTLAGFAAFSVKGWNFGGNVPNYYNNTAPGGDASLTCSNNCKGIIGRFVTYVALDNKYEVGPSTTFGATIVRLSQ